MADELIGIWKERAEGAPDEGVNKQKMGGEYVDGAAKKEAAAAEQAAEQAEAPAKKAAAKRGRK